jgi:hypothetical protein
VIVSVRVPRRHAFGADGFDHILQVLADRTFSQGFDLDATSKQLEKMWWFRVVVNDLDAALFVMVE